MCADYPPRTEDDRYVCQANSEKFLRVSKNQIETDRIPKILEHLRHGTSAQFVRDIHEVSYNFFSTEDSRLMQFSLHTARDARETFYVLQIYLRICR